MNGDTKLWTRYLAGQQYQHTMGFSDLFPKCVRFKEGVQWPAPTEKTQNLPRPVINVIDFFIRTKRANVLNQTTKLVFSPAEGGDGAEERAKEFSDYAENLWKEMDQDELNEDFIDDAATVGTGILHYYWDNDVSGGVRYPYRGALRGETLDPLSVFFSDPQIRDVQRQRWILIAQRYTVAAIQELARSLGIDEERVQLIKPDDERAEDYTAARHEMESDGDRKCTLLTMYYRKDGAVVFDRGTRAVELIKAQPLTPMVEGEVDPLPDDEDGTDAEAPGPDLFEPAMEREEITLYPLVAMSWNKRKKCIFGIGEAQGILHSQQAINWLMGMNILSAQDLAWPKLLVKPGALEQTVTNEPGEILTDYSPTGEGIRYLNPPNFSGFAVTLVDKLNDLLRTVSGVSEVASGEPFTATMAASAIIALQNQAKKPIENVQKRFYRSIKQVGRIWEQFFKTYYSMPRPYEASGPDGQKMTAEFLGTGFAGVEFALEVDAGAGSEYSEALAQSTLDKLFEGGHIDLDTYIDLCPKTVMPFKETLKQRREELAAMMPAMMPGMGAPGGPMQAIPQTVAPAGVAGVQLPDIPKAPGYQV